MTSSTPLNRVAASFGRAAGTYEDHAVVQRHAARAIAERISRLPLCATPRVLEIGCGTGLLTRMLRDALPGAQFTVSDISADMLAQARASSGMPDGTHWRVLDGEQPDLPLDETFDVICSSMAVQWFGDLPAGLARLTRHLRPGGHLVVSTLASDTFHEWRAAHRQLGLRAATPSYPATTALRSFFPRMKADIDGEHVRIPHQGGLDFLRSLRGIGATPAGADIRPLSASALRQVIQIFDSKDHHVTYDLAYATWQRPQARRGVFVTGTDTGVGKTLVSAILARAWNADYWKPLQTGIADEAGDTPTVTSLAELPAERIHAPAAALQAPLSPWAAARLEHVTLDVEALTLPDTDAPLVVEGAGGLYVPVDDHTMMLDLIVRFGLPVVLVARSGLGTINHTLLSLQALRAAGASVCGVVMSGPPSAGNREAIERFGKTRVIAEIPQLADMEVATIAAVAQRMPSLDDLMAAALDKTED